MIEPITIERWKQAQAEEILHHTLSFDKGYEKWKDSYSKSFRYLGINPDLHGKTIIEIGCAGFPALMYCENYKGIIIEPLHIPTLERVVKNYPILWIDKPWEVAKVEHADEIWLLNVMQHIIDPEKFIEKCKATADVIRFFEPINYPTCAYHPHTFTLDDFKRWFGEAAYYNETTIPNFHAGECAYGVWVKDKV